MHIGLDVGGTNTDAVLMDSRRVVSKVKTPTTPDVSSGIATALRFLLAGRETSSIESVMIGTTHFVNAVVERRELAPVAAVRLCLPAGAALPPRVDWPDDLRELTGQYAFLCQGGREFDGRPLSPLDPGELQRVAEKIAGSGVRQIAITGIFSPVQAEDERRAAEIFRQVMPEAEITLSYEVGRTGLLERENATILNSSLQPLAQRTVMAFKAALQELGLQAALYLTQNDGTVMTAEHAMRFPVFTFASGPTNSMRGAAFLCGLKEAMVVDIGGTTTDVGALVAGFPREAAVAVRVGGVRTNFRMPDVYSVGLGGGSLVSADGVAVGPTSVGYRLTEQALCFGGKTLTATDVAVAAGLGQIGSHPVKLPQVTVTQALATITKRVEESIDRMKVSSGNLPVVLVGGGSILIGTNLAGATEVWRPEHYEAANAIGAAIAQISGEIDRVYECASRSRETILDEAKAEAIQRAITAGARPDSVEIVDVYDIPLAYLPSQAIRVRVKAVGQA
jgi:N-methylhydantoinase A/oxoprolinase/acetone carboxylase beta subunit